MKAPEELATLYRKAAEEVRTRGLAKGAYEQGGKVCTVGALSVAATGDALGVTAYDDEILTPVARHLGWRGGDPVDGPFQAITDWNDTRAADAEDVARVLETVANVLDPLATAEVGS